MFLLDTNHCSKILRGDEIATEKLSQPDLRLSSCVIVKGELIFMAENSQYKSDNLVQINQFLSNIRIHNIDDEVANIYGELKASLFDVFAPKDRQKRRQFKLNKCIGIFDNAGIKRLDEYILLSNTMK